MSQKKRKRFIAGAVCPECQAMDTLMLFVRDNVEHVECVDCGFSKSQADDDVSQATRKDENVIGVFKPE